MTLGVAAWRNRRGRAGADDLHVVRHDSHAFGTTVSMTVLHRSERVARRAVAAAMAELELVERLMSLYRPQSELCRLNRNGRLDDPHPYLAGVLAAAQNVSRRTDGAFDVTVQPLWDLYAEAHRHGKTPDAAAVDAVRRNVDWRSVEISPRQIRLHAAQTAVTLNGIAQGFAADRVVAVLRRHGVQHALVDTGEIGTLGGKANDGPWRVGIRHPRRDDAHLQVAALQGRSLATSGDYTTTFGDDGRLHHLFDPHTGGSPGQLASVSVAAATATAADALSTAVFVLGPERGLDLVRSTPAADVLLVCKDGAMLATDGFPGQV